MAAPLPLDLKLVDPVDAWKPWQPTRVEWSRKWAAHLFRRAAFGAKPAELDRALTEGLPKTLERILVGAPDADALLEMYTEAGQRCKESNQVRVWWLSLMLDGGHPLREKLTLFWHNHFATSIAKVRQIPLMFEQNLTLRKHALGKFRPFLLEMSKNPAMLIWLDSNLNQKEAPNENYARELMELFSLGVGNYTEKDIRDAARAFTGWHTDSVYPHEAFEFDALEHDEGLKTVFGQSGNWNGDDVVRLCCDRPSCATFLVGKLYNFLVSETPPPRALFVPLEERLRKTDYDLADLVKTMLGSQFFFSPHAYRKRVKWPVEFTMEAIRSLVPERVPLSEIIDFLPQMGQVLFAPPNVKGWRTGTDWLNSATLLARNNFAESVAFGDWTIPTDNSSTSLKPAIPKVPTLPGTTAVAPQPRLTVSPLPRMDPVTTLYTTKPRNVTNLIQHMGELLFGDRMDAMLTARIEKFLHEPVVNMESTGPGQSALYAPQGYIPVPIASPGSQPDTIKLPELLPTLPREKVSPTNLAPPPREVQAKPKPAIEYGLESPEFKARLREALHAMMCMPEYQIN